MNEGKWTAAIIGLGFIGAGDDVSGDAIGQKVVNLDGTHAGAWAAHPRVKLAAGSSRDGGRRARFEARHPGVRTYADWRDLLRMEKPDIVSVASNSPYHAAITIACAEAGVRAVLCEKPLATCLADADRAVEACRRQETALAVNHSRRWHPLWRAAAAALREGAIGDLLQADVQWPSGRLGNIGTHLFDALRMLLGREARSVSGSLDPVVPPDCRGADFHDPGGWGVIAFEGGLRAFVNAPAAQPLPLAVRVTGSKGRLTVQGKGAAIELWQGGTRTLEVAPDGSNSLNRAAEDLVRCLEASGRPACAGEDGVAALEIIIGFHESHRLNGQWTSLPIRGDARNINVMIG